MTLGQVTIHIIFPNTISQEIADACLTEDEKSRAARFHFPKDAVHWSACRAALRQILAREIARPPREVPLIFSEFGKPALAPPFDSLHFNLSHCPDLAIVALCLDGQVGIDLEAISRAPELLECEKTFCHPEEIRVLSVDETSRALQLLQIWTAKEAVLKALGTGLSHAPQLVHVHHRSAEVYVSSDTPLDGIENQQIHRLENASLVNHASALSAPKTVNNIRISPHHI